MYIFTEDPDPGRCRNYRPSAYHVGKSLRCLGYEATRHYCQFEQETPPATSAWSINATAPAPKPWVSPLNNGGS